MYLSFRGKISLSSLFCVKFCFACSHGPVLIPIARYVDENVYIFSRENKSFESFVCYVFVLRVHMGLFGCLLGNLSNLSIANRQVRWREC